MSTLENGHDQSSDHRQSPTAATNRLSGFFTTPEPISRLFRHFPRAIYPANQLPVRAPRDREQHILYVFSDQHDEKLDLPSFNPSCLKWQVLLKLHDIPFRIVASSNHASPSGALPFLLPACKSTKESPSPVPSSKINSWIASQGYSMKLPIEPSRHELYHSLLSQPIRLAYLHALYLILPSFENVAGSRYIRPCSSNVVVQAVLSSSVQSAALSEVMAGSNAANLKIDGSRLYQEADEAFGALSTLLGDDEWFTSRVMEAEEDRSMDGNGRQGNLSDRGPGRLDAVVFSYTCVILSIFDEENPLVSSIKARANLVAHQRRLFDRCF